jgi:type IV secretory pathway VirB4 component
MDDFAKSKIASAILPNCAIKWLLPQPEVDGVRLSEILNLNEKEVVLVKQLRQVKGVYAHAFLMAQGTHAVVTTQSFPLEYWLATTDPRDLAAIEKLAQMEPELPRFAALSRLSEEYPQGVSAHEIRLEQRS